METTGPQFHSVFHPSEREVKTYLESYHTTPFLPSFVLDKTVKFSTIETLVVTTCEPFYG